jgi:Uma2 family endonuclease
MVSQLQPSSDSDLFYPESDGKPMADNTKQFRWIVEIQQNLVWLFANEPNVFVAGDLLWYPVQGSKNIVQAPDILVVFGRPKGDRGSYKQWEEANIAPQVVFEILSPSNTKAEMNRKLLFYDRYGVEEYYLYDPERNELSGWIRRDEFLDVIDSMADWVSPRLGIRFDLSGDELQIYRPDGEPFLSYTEIAQRAQQQRLRAEQAEQQIEQERLRAEQAEQQIEQERLRAEQERQRAEQLAQRLRELGIDPDQV